MTSFRKAALAIGVAAVPLLGAALASAAEPPNALAVLFGPPGTPPAIVVLTPSTPVPAATMTADPAFEAMRSMAAMMPVGDLAEIIARQNAMMQRIMQQMDASFPAMEMPGMQMPGQAGESSVVVTSVSNGNGSCSQVVTTAYDGGRPRVTVRRTGSACDALSLPQTRTIPADVPAAPELTPAPESPRLIQIDHRKPLPDRPLYRG